jgi:hypothetical protein
MAGILLNTAAVQLTSLEDFVSIEPTQRREDGGMTTATALTGSGALLGSLLGARTRDYAELTEASFRPV